jgi:hypothetical protein
VAGRGVAADVATAVLVAGTLGVVAWSVWVAARRRDLGLALAVAVPAALLVAPHALFYDAGLLVVPAIVLAGRPSRPTRWLLAAVWVAAFGQVAADPLGFTPVALGVVAVGAAAAWTTCGPGRGGRLAGTGEG